MKSSHLQWFPSFRFPRRGNAAGGMCVRPGLIACPDITAPEEVLKPSC